MLTSTAHHAPLFSQSTRGVTASLALGLALGLATAGATRPAHAADAPTARGVVGNNAPVNINNPQDKATLAERIDQALERAKAKQAESSRRTRNNARNGPQEIPAVQVRVPPEPPRTPTRMAPNTPPVVDLPAPDPQASRRDIQARAAELAASVAAGTAVSMAAAAPSVPLNPGSVRWDYSGNDTGPAHWAKLHPSFATCSQGQQQSPVQPTADDRATAPGDLLQASAPPFGGTVLHTGHGIAVQVDSPASVKLRGQVWRVVQLQFHHPAQERMHPQAYPMDVELRLVGPDGRQAIVSVPMQRGTNHPFLARIWPYLPLDTAERMRLPPTGLSLPELLPPDRRTYQYMGSLTEPPCTEGILRVVMKTPVSVGEDQLRLLQRLVPPNARPVQPLHGRAVLDVGAVTE